MIKSFHSCSNALYFFLTLTALLCVCSISFLAIPPSLWGTESSPIPKSSLLVKGAEISICNSQLWWGQLCFPFSFWFIQTTRVVLRCASGTSNKNSIHQHLNCSPCSRPWTDRSHGFKLLPWALMLHLYFLSGRFLNMFSCPSLSTVWPLSAEICLRFYELLEECYVLFATGHGGEYLTICFG